MLLIIFSNLTKTTKFKKLAQKSGISGVRIIQTPRELSHNGCSYAVIVPLDAQSKIKALIEESKIYPNHIFKKNIDNSNNSSYKKIN